MKVQRTDLGWRGNKASFRVSFNGANQTLNDAPNIHLTDSKTRVYSSAVDDTGRDISRFFRDFVIQKTAGTNMSAVTVQVNAGGGWVTCPPGFIEAATNMDNITPLAILRAGEADLVYIKLPPGCGLRLSVASLGAIDTQATCDIHVMMSNSSEKQDISRS
jgi:hypothetical protein